MPTNSKNVFYIETLMSPSYATVLATRPDVSLHRMRRDPPTDELAVLLQTAHAFQISASRQELPIHWWGADPLLAQTPNLLVVSSNGAGYDTIDIDACTRAGVLAVNQAGGNKEGVAEHALGFMLALTKRIGEADRAMRRAAGIKRVAYMGHDLLGRTLGIIGLGHVGTRLAELCNGLFRMRVLAHDPYLSAESIQARGATPATLDELLAQSDYVSVHCPLTAETRGMIGARAFGLIRPGAYYINTARGFIHDERALEQALAIGRLAGAGLDVWDEEPPPPDHPLLAFDTVLASPHTAGVTHESRDTIAGIAADQMLQILDGRRPPRLLNPEVWPAYCARFRAIMGHDVAE